MTMLKTVFFGPALAGKTELIKCLASGKYQEDYIPTIGMDFTTIKPNPDLIIQLWDVPVSGSFSHMFGIDLSLRGASKLNLVIPADKPIVIEDILTYLPLRRYDPIPDLQLIITKTDLGEPVFSDDDVQRLLEAIAEKDYNSPQVLYVSARDNTGIEELRQSLIESPDMIETFPASESVENNSFPKSYQKITESHSTVTEKAIALLRDYTKGTTPGLSTLSVLAHGHFKRNHTSRVRAWLRDFDNGAVTIDEVVSALNAVDKNPDGSLARRLRYIEEELKLSLSEQTTLQI